MEQYAILSKVGKLILEIDILKKEITNINKIPDTKNLTDQLSNTITNWIKTHPNSKLLDVLNVVK